MNILLLAPHPYYQERGTPIAVDLLVKVLSGRGENVDILTLAEGEDRIYRNVTIHRVGNRSWLQGIPPGFSFRKVINDVLMFFRCVRLLRRKRFDVIHAVEEAAFIAVVLSPFFKIPFIYDMDSSLSAQMVDKFAFLRPLSGALRFFESLPIKKAAIVVPMCERLALDASRYRSQGIRVLKDVSLVSRGSDETEDVRKICGVVGPLLMYIGNLEPYQGVDLMLQGVARALKQEPELGLVIIGGRDGDIAKYRKIVREMGAQTHIHFLGTRPVEDIGSYLRQADILLSPRTKGVNTPMKIYSYLASGVPVIATDLLTHTQVITEDIGVLILPTAEALAEAVLNLVRHPQLGHRLAENAKAFIAKEHSLETFKQSVNAIYDDVAAIIGHG